MEILQGLSGSVVAVTDQDTISYASPEALELLGWSERLVGQPLPVIIPARLRDRHLRGFQTYVQTGVSHLQGQTVRVPALRQNGDEVDVDLTIRVFRRPDGSKLAVAALSKAPLGHAPPSIRILEDALTKRVYELI